MDSRLMDKRRQMVLAWMALFTTTLMCGCAGSIQCYCDHPNIDGVIQEHERDQCFQDGHVQSCETNLTCVLKFHPIGDVYVLFYSCGESYVVDDEHSSTVLKQLCNNTDVPDGSGVILCCDSSDYCNEKLVDLYPPRPVVPTSTYAYIQPETSSLVASVLATGSPTDTSHNNNNADTALLSSLIAAFVVAAGVTALIVFVVALSWSRRRRVARKHNNVDANSSSEMMKFSLDDSVGMMSLASGSGRGDPGMAQRTIARDIKLTFLIGNGRYGQVYVGYYQDEPVAVKKFESRDERSWVREVQIYTTLLLRHENILGFIASDMLTVCGGVPELWLITEYHPLGSLHDFLSEHVVSKATTVRFILSCLSGLIHLHKELKGSQFKPAIAHRDIKSRNILVKSNNTCCIADFGLAVIQECGESKQPLLPDNPKQGTRRYMSPEVLGESINMRSFRNILKVDIYAMGLVMWEITKRCKDDCGRVDEYEVPFEGLVSPDPSFEDMRQLVVVEKRQPDIPERWWSDETLKVLAYVMKECWYENPQARPMAIAMKKRIIRLTADQKVTYEMQKTDPWEHVNVQKT